MRLEKLLGSNSKNIFFLDGMGALASAATTGLILPLIADQIGLTQQTLRLLGGLGASFGMYSLGCYFFLKKLKRSLLLAIIIANSGYCFLAVAIVLFHKLTLLGKGYFLGEVAIIVCLVVLELKILDSLNNASPDRNHRQMRSY